jgi:hypothetical protein
MRSMSRLIPIAYIRRECIRNEPRNLLTHDLRLIVNAFDGKEDFPEGLRLDDIKLPLSSKSSTALNKLCRNARTRRECCKEEYQA